MPTFYSDDLDIKPNEFLSACSRSEREELIEALIEDGYVKRHEIQSNDKNLMDLEWDEVISKISDSGRLRLTKEEEETIRKIASRL